MRKWLQRQREFRQRLAKGETLDELLVEAYALVREADKRVLGLFPMMYQVMGAISDPNEMWLR